MTILEYCIVERLFSLWRVVYERFHCPLVVLPRSEGAKQSLAAAAGGRKGAGGQDERI